MERKLAEISLDDYKQTQLSQAQDEFYRCDQEMRIMLDKMSLVQRLKVNELIKDYLDRQDMNQ